MPLILAGAARDDVRAAVHLRLRLVQIAEHRRSRKFWSPSLSVRTQAPSMYFLSPDSTFSATQRADILSSIFSPFMFWVVPTASRVVALPKLGMSMLIRGRKMKCVT